MPQNTAIHYSNLHFAISNRCVHFEVQNTSKLEPNFAPFSMPPRGPTPPLTGPPPPGGNPACRMQSAVMAMSSAPQHPGHLGPPPPHAQMHPGPMMLPVGASGGGIPSGLPGIHYAPHGPLPPGGSMPGGPDRPDHVIPQMPPGQQPQLGGPMIQHHHGPSPPQPGTMGVSPMPPHQQMPSGPMPPHNHPHHLHHPIHAPLPMHRGGFQTEYRIYEFNKRLQQRADESDSQWWEAFATDFFDDDATITITVRLEDGPKHFNIGRTLIPRYFRSIFESGCNELYFNLRHTRESFHNSMLTLESDCASMVMNMARPFPATVFVDAQFTLGFTLDELMRIRNWTFQIRSHRELIVRSVLGVQDPMVFEQISKNVTRSGILANTLHFLRLCVILEPMQELMSRQKFQNISPRDCLRNIVMNRWKRMTTIPSQPTKAESNRQTNKRRKRKGSSANSETGGGRATKRKQSPVPLPPQSLAQPGDILIVGEPTLMGGEFGEDDERMITRLENSQYDPAAAAAALAAQQQQQQQLNAISGAMPPQQQQQQQQHHHHPTTTSGMSPFSRPPSFPPAFPPGGGTQSSSPMLYAPGLPYAPPPPPPPQQPPSSSPSMKPHQSPLYGHPNSVPPQPLPSSMPYSGGGGGGGPPGSGGSMMPASVPPHAGAGGGRIMSPMGSVGMGNPSTPIGPGGPSLSNAPMMFAPPPSLADSEPGGGGGMGQQPPRSSSASSLNNTSLPPAFPPPPEGVTPPPNLQQQNGPVAFQGQKSPTLSSPGVSVTGSLHFPPPLTSHFDSTAGGSGGRAPTPRLQPASVSGQQLSDGSGPGSIGRSETPNPNGFSGNNMPSLLNETVPTSTASSSTTSSCVSMVPNALSASSHSAPNGSGVVMPSSSSCQGGAGGDASASTVPVQ
ncbi:LIM domain-binding protein 2 [Taenia crassiceps]|uniref:LIM domain-binding protein 2 n=1 Tax=Taenia crassiceps TaxID=6207 RepID=A0ABR4QT77_9CEST